MKVAGVVLRGGRPQPMIPRSPNLPCNVGQNLANSRLEMGTAGHGDSSPAYPGS